MQICLQEASTSQGAVEKLERISDSNSAIKGRLSEAMRDDAKHMLDPERTFEGRPIPARQPNLFTGGIMRWYQVEGIEWLRVSGPKRGHSAECGRAWAD